MRGESERDDDRVPLFHINDDGDKGGGGLRAPPRNKMALLGSETSEYRSRSSVRSFASRASSSSSNERKIRPIFATMNECPHSADWYYPQNPTTKCSPGDEHSCAFRKTLDYRNHQVRLDRVSGTLHTACLNEKAQRLGEENCEFSQNNPSDGKKIGWGDETSPSTYPYSSPSSSDIDLIHHDRASKLGNAVKKEEFCITTDEVMRVIGPRLFLEARKTMFHQQKMFSWQMFELHRLITVQRILARSPGSFRPIKPSSIKFPPMNKLLYVSPLDASSPSPKTKDDGLKSEPGLPLPTTSVEKVLFSQPLPNPAPPLCFPPPPGGNHWLVPVRSPSEGLVYKPYPGPCFPSVGLMPPVCGTLGSGSGSLSGAPYGVPAPNEPEIGQSYYQTFHPTPLINASTSVNEVKLGEVDKSSFKLAFDCGGRERDALSLFPTTPSTPLVDVLKEQRNEHKVQVIKAVPHSRDATPASIARILQSLQEERRKHN
ncbi:hypothetical protein ACS0TY_012741 [Phlomoides rotata]